jgi:hypothetical protein
MVDVTVMVTVKEFTRPRGITRFAERIWDGTLFESRGTARDLMLIDSKSTS